MSRLPKQKEYAAAERSPLNFDVHPDVKKIILVITFLTCAVLFVLAAADQAGPAGQWFYASFNTLFGWGYYLLPTVSFLFAFAFITPEPRQFVGLTLIGGFLFVVSGLGFIDLIAPDKGGLTGSLVGSLEVPFGLPASLIITFATLVASFLVTLNRPLKLFDFSRFKQAAREAKPLKINVPAAPPMPEITEVFQNNQDAQSSDSEGIVSVSDKKASGKKSSAQSDNAELALTASMPNPETLTLHRAQKPPKNYVPPPLSLLVATTEQPTIGDLRANANIIKRTLESFGIPVEMGEINVGPTVTRYTLKPAEGVKLARLTTLHQDLALALAAHPIRIEAPIPGKSLVGIEVPNKSAALVRLGSLLLYPEFQKSDPLIFALGRNVSGEPEFADIARMPHLLIAGATGSGKSIMIHDLILSLLFKNSPEMLRMVLIDPKRVELSVYNALPHLLTPVIIDNKKAIGALRWLIKEMDRRYQILLEAGARDMKSYNKHTIKLPYLIIIIDELADLMSTYGKELEGSIIRLAQMARATGIHLIVSTQRPSVEVITGLIKANITTRIAMQVASQIDSRTILDTSGAEKLLGHGDLLYVSAELSKPKRIQGTYITEEEIKNVIRFIAEHNEQPNVDAGLELAAVAAIADPDASSLALNFDEYSGNENDDELYEEAVGLVRTAGRASASFLQRRLSVGYARAARLLDMMEERGIIGPPDGAKPRNIMS